MKNEHYWLIGLSGLAVYLLFTESGKGIASQIATGIEDIMTARGIRNNNPGNIRLSSTKWQGQSAEQTDPDFIQFVSPEYGIRAINKILNSYALRGINTVQDIISAWAPPSENDTDAYIAAVTGSMGVAATDTVTVVMRPALIAAIIRHENGQQPYTIAQIDTGTSMA